ncbi:hypothetical protein SAMN06265348_102179 [Pedobacter westerhofensis]|uniref:TonB protein C-terminal n=1 Tax=Pedobacter westerhofensis TaxID=425512 RepID=A0A521BC14_9SPHI|nr:hypothetical protein [Pedobacter westerhofensis]SMO44598.1 hypothetical protein SAMN06265348_102179 [Pedobacter westerhofensis]
MRMTLTILILILAFTVKAQENSKIYYDNRDSSVVKFFSQSEVPRILAENPRFGFTTINFSVSREGKIISIIDLIKSEDIFFSIAKIAIEKSSGKWIIKPGVQEQTFQITFFIIGDKLASRKKSEQYAENIKPLLRSYIQYEGNPKELTLLPTIDLVFKEIVVETHIFH